MAADHSAILQQARERFQIASEAERRVRDEALDDLRFMVGDQWPENIKAQRDADNRPCLTVNRLPVFCRQVLNEQRQNRPGIQINPVDDKSDPETAEILQGIIRHIEVSSSADLAYDQAFEHAVIHGFGYVRVVTDYIDPLSFDQEIQILPIRNPFCVYFDPSAQLPDYSDAEWCFLVQRYSHDGYKAAYPDSELASADDFESIGDQAPDWIGADGCLVVEYFWREHKAAEIGLCSDGQVRLLDKPLPAGVEVLKKRPTQVPQVRTAKLNACEILEEPEWMGDFIPIVPCLGSDLDVNGERHLSGIIRHAKDPQRMVNYWSTAETEAIALAPRVPFIGGAGQFEGFEEKWENANRQNFAYLEYNPTSINGEPIPPPQRNTFEPAIAAISHARLQASDDLKATTGFFDASLGANGGEKSGKAILARQREGDVANLHYTDNFRRTLRHVGKIVLNLIPKVYDTPRVVRMLGLEDEIKQVQINSPFEENGQLKCFDVTVGRYDVTITSGPSFTTRRQEAVESMLSLASSFPGLVQIAGDILVKSMDWPGAEKIAERLKKMLPPQLQEGNGEKQQPIPQAMQQYVQQLTQQHELLTQQLHGALDALEHKSLEIASRERIELMKIQADVVKAEAMLRQKDGALLLQAETQRIQTALGQVHQANESESQRQHEAQQAQQAQQAQAQQAQQAQAQQAQQAQQFAMQQDSLPKAA